MDERAYADITYTTAMNLAKELHALNPSIVFNFITGAHTDLNGKQMWQRVKDKTETDLANIGFRGQYNFRPGFMKPVKVQKNVKWFFKPVIAVFPYISPSKSLTVEQIGQAMINLVKKPHKSHILEITDIKEVAAI